MKTFIAIACLVSLAAAASVKEDAQITVDTFKLIKPTDTTNELKSFDCDTTTSKRFLIEYTKKDDVLIESVEILKDGIVAASINSLDLVSGDKTLNAPFRQEDKLEWNVLDQNVKLTIEPGNPMNKAMPGSYQVRIVGIPPNAGQKGAEALSEKLDLTSTVADGCIKNPAEITKLTLKDESLDGNPDADNLVCKKDTPREYSLNVEFTVADELNPSEAQFWQDGQLIATSAGASEEEHFPEDSPLTPTNAEITFNKDKNTAKLLMKATSEDYKGDYTVKIIPDMGAMPGEKMRNLKCGASYASISFALMMMAFVVNKFLA